MIPIFKTQIIECKLPNTNYGIQIIKKKQLTING